MKKNSLRLARVKTKTLELNALGQLPYELVRRIVNLSNEDSKEKVAYYMELVQHYLRVRGYYKKYPEASKTANGDIKKLCLERGYIS